MRIPKIHLYRIKFKPFKKRFFGFGALGLFMIALIWPMNPPFPDCYSTLVYDKNDHLLRVFLAPDEQYRFPPSDKPLPSKYLTCLLTYEDKRYYLHPGVDPLALIKAMMINMKAGARIRGGSTITMQIARLSHPKSRTYINKIYEIWTAIRLTLHFSKERILREYAAHVPMGGNIVGVETACVSYFGKSWESMTWAEAALFVVLPNAPSQINLEKERPMLLEKRNRLLRVLLESHVIDSTTCHLSCQEPLPQQPRMLPFEAPHFCEYVYRNYPGHTVIHTSMDMQIQHRSEELVRYHYTTLKSMGINNLSVLIAETQTGKIRAYIGSPSFTDSLNNGQVDGVQAFRSTGSLLKPFLVAKALDRGPFTLQSVIQDVPTFYGTFAPMNSSKKFSGLVTLEQALTQSLNVPMIRLLNQYGLNDFYNFLKDIGLKGLFRTANGYGLPLILGGAEASLWELVQMFLILGNLGESVHLSYTQDEGTDKESPLFSQGASWQVLNVISQLSRPEAEYYWHYFNNQIPVAWKTGTSYGQKDGWAIGVNRQWTIGVWAGNFTGEGNAALSGAQSAAPLLFDLFNQLCDHTQPLWFDEPEHDLIEVDCCSLSGYPAGPDCPEIISLKRPLKAYRSGQCPFHHKYVVDKKTGQAVCSLCWGNVDTAWICRYILSPGVRNVYQKLGIPADTIPSHMTHCPLSQDQNRLEIVYPLPDIKIFIPREITGVHEKLVLSVKHQQNHARCFWFLNHKFVGETVGRHDLTVDLEPGDYNLTVQDHEGFSRSVRFSVYKKPIEQTNE